MQPSESEILYQEDLGRYAYSISLGFREFLFIFIIFFFGFCGFSVCLDKSFSDSSGEEIKNMSIHNLDSKEEIRVAEADHQALKDS